MKETGTAQYLFLLGGQDLEMVTIRKILRKHHLRFADRKLNWGARLSDYADLLGTDVTFVGIELIPDIPPPASYIIIDHHNAFSDRPSSLEQLATLLGIRLTRYQQLVAINDARYIPGMMEWGATSEEILKIRKADRKAQGVTAKDEKLAQISIRENLSHYGDLTIVRTACKRFSPISDALFPYYKLLIYSDIELTYYGRGIDSLVALFKPLIAAGKAYHGGGSEGFFGIPKYTFPLSDLMGIKNKIIETTALN